MLHYWKNTSITTKFASGFGVFLLLLVMIVITAYYSLDSVHNAEMNILASTEIQDLVSDMELEMEKARRLHADFFLYYRLIGFPKAYDLYARPSTQQISKVLKNSVRLKEMLKNPHTILALRNSHIDLNLYLSSAQRFAETSAASIQLTRELAAPVDGLEVLFDRYTQALQEETTTHPALNGLFERMVSFSKDYLINRHRFLMQSSFNISTRLKTAIENGSLDPEQKQDLLALLAKWRETADRILLVDVDLKSKFNDFSLQTEVTEPASSALIKLAKEDVAHAQRNISQAHSSALFIMAVITTAGLLLAVGIAGILNTSITQNIIKLTESAEEFRRGNLTIKASGEGPDELGRLASTFNTMAARIRELVNELERKVQERTLQLSESEKRFRTIIENTTQGVLITDVTTTRFLYANPSVAAMLGYDEPEMLIGKSLIDIHPENAKKTMTKTFKAMVEGKVRIAAETPCIRQDGTTFFADIVAGEVTYGGRQCLVGFYMDTTEKHTMQAQLERARKMEAIGLLAGGVAHDLNNILSGIVSYPELILLQLPADSGLRKPIEAIHDSGKRAAAVVSDLLTVARGVASTKETTNLNNLILEYLSSPEHLEIQSSHIHITCRKDLDPDVDNVCCSVIHVKKCILNLMINAMEAINDQGFISLATRNREIDDTFAAKIAIKPGRYIVLSISDTGHGIQEKDLNHIFEPFYTKKAMGKSGTGLGLAVVWNSMQDHDGTITVKSSEQGTVFQLYFPASDQPLPTQEGQTPLAALYGDGETILVVDDEHQQLDIANRILKTLGYDPHCVRSGEQAIAYMEKNRADLILLDMIMPPGLSGLQTFKHIVQLHPDQKALMVSGFADSDDVRIAQTLGARGFIKKPYSIEQLGRAVKEELKRSKTAGNSALDPFRKENG